MLNNLSDDQKAKITEWVENNRKFEDGDLVTVDYTKSESFFVNAEYGGVPLRVVDVSWRQPTWVSDYGLHHIEENNNEDELIEVFTDEDIYPENQFTEYVTVTPEYQFDVAVRTDVECNRTIPENSLIKWENYEGELQFCLRNEKGSESLQDGEECPICGYSAERRSHWSNGVVSAGSVSCAVCGFVKEEHAP